MEKIKEYLTNPATWISFIVFIFWLWVCYATLNFRLTAVEKWQSEMDVAGIQTSLAQIQTDIQWIKLELQK